MAAAVVVIDEFDDECIDDSDDCILFFGYDVKPPDVATGCNCVLLSYECNNDDDDADAPVGNIKSTGDSSSVSGSERVRWWKQLRWWFDFVNEAIDGVGIVALDIELITCVNDWFILIWDCSGFNSLGDVVDKVVVVIGNENALWCDTVNSFDARTEKLFAATTVKTKERK